MSRKLKILLIIVFCIVILLALQITANSFRAQSTINSWVETAFQSTTTQENDQIKILGPAQSTTTESSSPDFVNKSRR